MCRNVVVLLSGVKRATHTLLIPPHCLPYQFLVHNYFVHLYVHTDINIPEWRRVALSVYTVVQTNTNYLVYVAAFSILQKATISFVMSVCPQGTTRFPLDEFS